VSRQEPERPDVYRITSATGSRSADQQQRASRYLFSMGIRTLCVILCIVVPGPLRWVFAVGAIVLPYIAVVAANSVGERRERPLPPPPPIARRGLAGAPQSPQSPQPPQQYPGPAPEQPAQPTSNVPGARRAS
jgi:hypothetical protein